MNQYAQIGIFLAALVVLQKLLGGHKGRRWLIAYKLFNTTAGVVTLAFLVLAIMAIIFEALWPQHRLLAVLLALYISIGVIFGVRSITIAGPE